MRVEHWWHSLRNGNLLAHFRSSWTIRYIPLPRFGYGKPAHPGLYSVYDRDRDRFADLLGSFLKYEEDLIRIPMDAPDPRSPFWFNGSFQGLDAVALYCLIAQNRSKRSIEIGSGNSTKFAREAAQDHGIPLHITSLDPAPRAEIDDLCDSVVRSPLEDVDLSIFNDLDAGDVFFVDGSHRCFMNSDVTVVFTELLPATQARCLGPRSRHLHPLGLPAADVRLVFLGAIPRSQLSIVGPGSAGGRTAQLLCMHRTVTA